MHLYPGKFFFDRQVLDSAVWNHAHRAVPVAEILPESLSETGEKLKDVATRLARTGQVKLRTDVDIREIIK